MNNTKKLDWVKAQAHLDVVKELYQGLAGMPRVNVGPVLMLVISPIERRFNSGERSNDLYFEIMELE